MAENNIFGADSGAVAPPIGPQQELLNTIFSNTVGEGGGDLTNWLRGLASPEGDTSWITNLAKGGANPFMDWWKAAAYSGRPPGIPEGTGMGTAKSLHRMALGKLPQPLVDLITGNTNEQFGAMGNRFGTDVANATARGVGEAGAQATQGALQQLIQGGSAAGNLGMQAGQLGLGAVGARQRSIEDILGLGKDTAQMEFQGTQSALDRALAEFLQSMQLDSQAGGIQNLIDQFLGR